jgi:UDP-glucose 4-epimerase
VRSRSVLVTGGSGFVGRHVVSALRAAGVDVSVADLQPYPDDAVHVILGDLTAPGGVIRALTEGTDAVVHLAAVTSVLGSIQRPVETYRTNAALTAELLERCRLLGVRTFVLASTNAVVGAGAEGAQAPDTGDAGATGRASERPTGRASERPSGAANGRIDEQTPLRPLTPYGATKAAAEMLVSAYDAAYGVRGVALRFTNVYGTGMAAKDSIVARIMRAAVSGSTFEIYGDGAQRRDYLFAGDVVSAVSLALDTEARGPIVIGSGTSTSVLELLDTARTVTGTPLPARHVPPKIGEMPGVQVDPSRAAALGWRATVGVEEGLARVWKAWDRLVPAR